MRYGPSNTPLVLVIALQRGRKSINNTLSNRGQTVWQVAAGVGVQWRTPISAAIRHTIDRVNTTRRWGIGTPPYLQERTRSKKHPENRRRSRLEVCPRLEGMIT